MLSLGRNYLKNNEKSSFTGVTTFDWSRLKQRSVNEAALSITESQKQRRHWWLCVVCPRRGIHPYEKRFFESKYVSPEKTWYPENLPKSQCKRRFLCTLKLLCVSKPTKILVNPAEKLQNRSALWQWAANAEIPGFASIWLFQCRTEEVSWVEQKRTQQQHLHYILQFQEPQEQRTSPQKAPSTWEALLCTK